MEHHFIRKMEIEYLDIILDTLINFKFFRQYSLITHRFSVGPGLTQGFNSLSSAYKSLGNLLKAIKISNFSSIKLVFRYFQDEFKADILKNLLEQLRNKIFSQKSNQNFVNFSLMLITKFKLSFFI